MKNFYIDENNNIKHNRLPIIMDVFIKNARNPHKGEQVTHGQKGDNMWGSIICFFGGIAVGTLLAYTAEAIDYYKENKIRSNGKKKGRK